MLGAFTFYETQLKEFSEQLKSQNPIMKKVSGGGIRTHDLLSQPPGFPLVAI